MSQPRPSGRGWMAHCPAHKDRTPSLSIAEGDDGRVLVNCFAGCSVEDIVAAVGVTTADLFSTSSNTHARASGRGTEYSSTNGATQPPEPSGCTVATYAAAKKLPVKLLRDLGLTDFT